MLALRRPPTLRRLVHTTAIRWAQPLDNSVYLFLNDKKPGGPPAPPVPYTNSPRGGPGKGNIPALSLVDGKLRSVPGLSVAGPGPRAQAKAASAASPIDAFLVSALRLYSRVAEEPTTIGNLLQQMKDRNGTMLDFPLAYEGSPTQARRLSLAPASTTAQTLELGEQDGIVIVAHVFGVGADANVELSSGFAIGAPAEGEGSMIATVTHSLLAASNRVAANPLTPSASFAIVSSGHIFPVSTVLSSSLSSDLLILRLAPEALRDPAFAPAKASKAIIPKLKSLPISPFPPPSGTPVGALVYTEVGSEREWKMGRVVEYYDDSGTAVEVGTYEELSSLTMSIIPQAGASGGPIVEVETGAVIGIIRGSRSSYATPRERGFGTPAEKLNDMFCLPGFQSKASREAEAEAEAKAKASASTAPTPSASSGSE